MIEKRSHSTQFHLRSRINTTKETRKSNQSLPFFNPHTHTHKKMETTHVWNEILSTLQAIHQEIVILKHLNAETVRSAGETRFLLETVLKRLYDASNSQSEPDAVAPETTISIEVIPPARATTPAPPDVDCTVVEVLPKQEPDPEAEQKKVQPEIEVVEAPVEEEEVEEAEKEQEEEEKADPPRGNGPLFRITEFLRHLFPRVERFEPDDPKILMALVEMGFKNEVKNKETMIAHKGAISRVIDDLIEGSK